MVLGEGEGLGLIGARARGGTREEGWTRVEKEGGVVDVSALWPTREGAKEPWSEDAADPSSSLLASPGAWTGFPSKARAEESALVTSGAS